jgi:hypothetical protein
MMQCWWGHFHFHFRLPFFLKGVCHFIFFEVVFHHIFRSSSKICSGGCLPFLFLFWRSSSIFLRLSFYFFKKNWGRLPFSFFLRSSFIFHFFLRSSSIFFWGCLSSWVKIRLHTENQLPILSGSALKVELGWGGVVGGPTNNLVYPNYSWVEFG